MIPVATGQWHVELHIVCITAEVCYVCKQSDPREECRLKENINPEVIWKNQKMSVRELSLISSVLTANTVGKNFVRTSDKQHTLSEASSPLLPVFDN